MSKSWLHRLGVTRRSVVTSATSVNVKCSTSRRWRGDSTNGPGLGMAPGDKDTLLLAPARLRRVLPCVGMRKVRTGPWFAQVTYPEAMKEKGEK